MRTSRVWMLTLSAPIGCVAVLDEPRQVFHAANRAQPVRAQAHHVTHVGARFHQSPADHGSEEFHPLLVLAIGVPAPGGRDDLDDLPFPHLFRPLPGRPFPSSSSIGWLRRHASFSSSERRSLSSRRRSAASLALLFSLHSRSRSARRSVMLPLHLRWSVHLRRRPTICPALLPMSPAQRTPD